MLEMHEVKHTIIIQREQVKAHRRLLIECQHTDAIVQRKSDVIRSRQNNRVEMSWITSFINNEAFLAFGATGK